MKKRVKTKIKFRVIIIILLSFVFYNIFSDWDHFKKGLQTGFGLSEKSQVSYKK